MPDEKIPAGKALRVPCPKCKTPIEINDKAFSPAGEVPAGGAELPEIEESAPPPSPQEDAYPLDMVEEGVHAALLCVSDPSRAAILERILVEMDFRVFRGANVSSAVSKIHHNAYSLVVLDESFDGGSPTQNLVLGHIQLLPMDMRRQLFVCLLSEGLQTLDQLAAFRMGVDMVLNLKDLSKTRIILNRTMKEHFVLYRIYKDELNRRA